uniref:Rho GTPase activating protein 4a n=2 Tax=Nothobranchius furzeri TaxID=105023 RepID=A0A1A8U7E4_NOTFU
MSSHAKHRKERVGTMDYDTQIREVRCQLVDQLKVLDLQLEQKTQQLQDMTDYLRRRGEIENEYARSLERLAERFTLKIKRKDPGNHSVSQVWVALLSQTRQESRDHCRLGESCSNLLVQPIIHCLEYTQRLAKKSKDLCSQLQDGLLKVTTELLTAWRTYFQYHSEFVCAEGKLREAEKQEEKQKQSNSKKLERLIEKRQIKVQEIQLKCSKARNDYLLNLAAANSSMNKYFLQDISTLIDCADVGYHLTLGRVMQAYLSRRVTTQQKVSTGLEQLQEAVSELDQGRDRDVLLQEHYSTFSMPLRFPYQPHEGDQISEVGIESETRCEMETRFKQIQTRMKAVTQESGEARTSMSAARSSLLEGISDDDLESNSGSGQPQEGSNENLSLRPNGTRRRANLQEIENLYFTRVKEFLVGSSLESKLQAKHDLLKEAVEKEASNERKPRNSLRSRIKKNPSSSSLLHNHKLFSGDMLSFIQESGQQIPFVVESCIRFINLYGLHHEGIFRVPGSQMDVNSLKDAFEQGNDPLAGQKYDLDSVAGVLKLYFRCLKTPLFPISSTNQLLEHAHLSNEAERAAQLKAVISSYPEPIIIVMRYLFAFLHHVSQYSDENMMQPYNLAVCFGPSLVRGEQDDDVVTLQPQINALVKSIIIQHESIFPSQSEVPGPVYEKCMSLEQDDSEALIEEGEVEAELTFSKDDLEMRFTPANGTAVSVLAAQMKAECPQANSSDALDHSRRAAGGGAPSAAKSNLQIPIVPPSKLRKPLSPSFMRRETRQPTSSEDILKHVDKAVCRQMELVFKELLLRRAPQEPSSVSTPSAQAQQKKGKWEGWKGR